MSRLLTFSVLPIALLACHGAGAPPCAQKSWGSISSPDKSVHVREDGDDLDPGTAKKPVATLKAALELTRAGLFKRIAVGPGTFRAGLDLLGDAGDGQTDAGLAIEACGVDETTLVPAEDAVPQIKVTEATGVEIAGMTLQGGDRPLWVWGGGEVSASSIDLLEGRWAGFVVDGPYTLLELRDVNVRRTQSVDGVGGYGAEIDSARVTWEGGSVLENTAAGIVVNGETAQLSLSSVEISDTSPDDAGLFGRGVQIQGFASANLLDCTLDRNHDAAIFSLLGQDLVVERAHIHGVSASGDGGDGIVVTGIDADDRQLDPSLFTATLTDNTIEGAPRAGAVLERVTATVSGNGVTDAAEALVAQEGAVFSGPDAVTELTEPLVLHRELLGAVLDPP